MSSRYLIVTDGQTDGQTDESNLITALCTSASRGKKRAPVSIGAGLKLQEKIFSVTTQSHPEVCWP